MLSKPMVKVYTGAQQGSAWLARYRGRRPQFACVLGFTATGLIPHISAAGATPADREYTAIADAEFLVHGPRPHPIRPLPPLQVGVSPVLISRAVLAAQAIPIQVFNAGLSHAPTVPCIELGGMPARCLSSGRALDRITVERLLQQGLKWGQILSSQTQAGYLILSECVVGGTTTALALLVGLGIDAWGKVNSSHVTCNHAQKQAVVTAGLERAGLLSSLRSPSIPSGDQAAPPDPLRIVAAVGDPMQIVVAGMALAASRTCGVLLAGGTQMLAVYALAQAIAQFYHLSWEPEQVVVGTTRWVAEDPTGGTVALAQRIGSVPLLATQLSFASSRIPQLRAYEQGYVKEGVGAGGCAIAAHLYQGWENVQMLNAIESLIDQYADCSASRTSSPG